jgi:hypothetical protein
MLLQVSFHFCTRWQGTKSFADNSDNYCFSVYMMFYTHTAHEKPPGVPVFENKVVSRH